MKRMNLFVLLLTLLFMGCSHIEEYPADDFYYFDTDSQYGYTLQGQDRIFAESEDGYYFVLSIKGTHYLFFTDKTTMETIPLCNKPNCLHYEEEDYTKRSMCNAFFIGRGGYFTSLFYNNGKLYIPTLKPGSEKTYVTEFSADGSSRKDIVELDGKVSGCNMVFHRGYLYAAVNSYNVDKESWLKIMRYSIDKPSSNPICIYEEKRVLNRENGFYNEIFDLRAFGTRLYFTTRRDGSNRFYYIELEGKEQQPNVFLEEIGSETERCYTIALSDDFSYAAINNLTPEINALPDDQQLPNMKSTIYKTDLEGNNPQELMNIPYGYLIADDRYFYSWDCWPLKRDGNIDHFCIRIYDAEGNLLVNHDAQADVADFGYLYASQEEIIFLSVPKMNKVYYFSKSDIETGEIHPKLLIDCSQYG